MRGRSVVSSYQLIPKTFDISTAALAVEIFIKLQVISFPFLSFCPHNSHCHLQQLDKELRGKILPQGIKDLEKYLVINYSKQQGSILKYLQIVVFLKIEREKILLNLKVNFISSFRCQVKRIFSRYLGLHMPMF